MEKTILLELLYLLKHIPQSYHFADVPSKLSESFTKEIDKMMNALMAASSDSDGQSVEKDGKTAKAIEMLVLAMEENFPGDKQGVVRRYEESMEYIAKTAKSEGLREGVGKIKQWLESYTGQTRMWKSELEKFLESLNK